MLTLTVYLKTRQRMPVRFGLSVPFRDVQGDIPFSWCSCCGSEVFDRGEEMCIRCRKRKER